MQIQNNLDGHYRLMNDIYLTMTEWEPVGTAEDPFTGVFEGNQFSVNNMIIYSMNYQDKGLFGVVSDAKISDLGVHGMIVVASYEEITYSSGGLAGRTALIPMFLSTTVMRSTDLQMH